VIKINLLINPEETTTVILDFIKTYVQNSGCNGVVLGLSGGIDSSVAALLCKKALGDKKVLCLFMPDDSTPDLDIKHQELFTDKFGINCKIIEIDSIVQQIKKNYFESPGKMTISNIKARIRMTLVYAHANEMNSLVCGTSNKSEILIGYYTKYGDGGVDFQPMGDLYKTQIYQLAKHLKIPKPIISKPPSAGLWDGQTDEKELGMSYEKLDKILYGLENKLDYKKIQKITDINISDIKRICKMRKKTQHKRRTPIIPKIGIRTPGLDWRSPVQEG